MNLEKAIVENITRMRILNPLKDSLCRKANITTRKNFKTVRKKSTLE